MHLDVYGCVDFLFGKARNLSISPSQRKKQQQQRIKLDASLGPEGCYHVFSPELGTSGERLTSNQKNQYCTLYDGLHKQVFQILFLFYA